MTQKVEEAKTAQKEMQPFYDEAVKQMLNYKPIPRDNYAKEPFFGDIGDVLVNGWRIKSRALWILEKYIDQLLQERKMNKMNRPLLPSNKLNIEIMGNYIKQLEKYIDYLLQENENFSNQISEMKEYEDLIY